MTAAADVGPPTGLRTEYAEDPLGVDVARPRFSWLPTGEGQMAYQVRVASAADLLAVGGADLWDSGKVPSGDCGQVAYAGRGLESAQSCHWAARVWDAQDRPTPWSTPATFETGLFTHEDWCGARWIGHADRGSEGELAAPLLRKRFHLTGAPLVRARLYLSGLGYGVAHLDDRRVGDSRLDPAPTDYAKTVLYTVHDVTAMLADHEPGSPHVLAVELGRGRYGEPASSVWYWHKAPWWDHPKLLALLTVCYADGRADHIVSDASWRATAGPTRFDSLYLGERRDARLDHPGWTSPGYDDRRWQPATPMQPPAGVLRAQQMPPIRAVADHLPVAIHRPVPGRQVVDFGMQLTGHVRLRVAGSRGHRVQVRYGERLDAEGLVRIDQRHIDGEIQTDAYTLCGGEPETFEPQFSYKGFQYVQVDGCPGELRPEDVHAIEVHTDVAPVGEFACDHDVVNRIHAATRRAILNNLHGLPTDTPTYEKNGWTADAHLTAAVAAYTFHLPRLYTKWLRDIADAQLPSGELPPIVPTSGWGYRGSDASITAPVPAWDAAYVEIPWLMYHHYGDRRILADHYDGQRRYLDFLVRHGLSDGVAQHGLGDFLAPGTEGLPPEGPGVHETAYTYRIVTLLQEIATVLGRTGDLAGFAEVARTIRAGFHAAFWNDPAGTYRGTRATGYRQTPNVLALAFGLVPTALRRRVLDGLIADIHARDNHLDTGVLGTKHLFPVLTDDGKVDLALEVAVQSTYPGYGFWFEQGATALFEAWHAEARSRNHHFYGSVGQWFYESIAGVSPAAPGFAAVRIRPVPPTALGSASARVTTVRGLVATAWRRVTTGIDLTVSLPPGVTAEVSVPLAGRALSRAPSGARLVRREPGYDVYATGSGDWIFHGE